MLMLNRTIPHRSVAVAVGLIALAGIDAITSDYPTHSRAARDLAREYFAADRVLGVLFTTVGL